MFNKHDSIHYTHDVTMYVPCFFSLEAGYPGFSYQMSHATCDEQLAWSMEPDYVLVLKGKFDAKTQPYDEKIREYNRGCNEEKKDQE